ncbi:aminotransferase class I and II [Denitrovibrio acetiphilus DSM 12809]|uniref:Aminotransferase class I and II n=1 Tax=Denitrovibrio acetiphilus (strain DSM 12809 / NBRC 114555 / N2460) TaxID=522772 RepID=D4H1U2_DENA2|nr:aminotransferase class I/II-fold pyridoxal phosphate-dependent enzyme [Denitrovibrio acetiphilus]ADD66919.1 aminotransferase class I and II [Denitrovibrio acetiphilus DSM 12809]
MKRTENLTPFIVMDILQRANEIGDCIHFEVGQPDMAPSGGVLDGMREALDDGQFPYTPAKGIMPLREKISDFYKQYYRVQVSPERVMLTVGTSGAFLIAYSILVDIGEKLAFTDPGYPCYKNYSYVLGIDPVMIPVGAETNYQMTAGMLAEHENVKAVQISSPCNPTGNLYGKENLLGLIEYCKSKDIGFISDEIYHGLVYSGVKEHTALEFSDDAIVINGFSKYFCMPGARLGWMILPEKLVRPAEVVMQNLFISAPTMSQIGCVHAFDYKFLEDYKAEYEKRRDFLYNELKSIFKIDVVPEGAFYIWADISEYSDDCYNFALELLENARIAVTPGVDFGRNNTGKYIRFAYTRNIEHMAEGIRRLKEYLKQR